MKDRSLVQSTSESPQNSAATQLEPILAPRKRRSIKPPPVQTAVMAKFITGESKSQISRDLEISRGTVDSILSAAEIEQHILSGRSKCVQMIPTSIGVIERKLEKNSETAALAILRGTQVLTNQPSTVNQMNIQANTWIQMRQQRDAEVPDSNGHLHNNAAQAGTNDQQQIADVVDKQSSY